MNQRIIDALKAAAEPEPPKRPPQSIGLSYFIHEEKPLIFRILSLSEQFRVPRSKKKRIRKKWAKRLENWRHRKLEEYDGYGGDRMMLVPVEFLDPAIRSHFLRVKVGGAVHGDLARYIRVREHSPWLMMANENRIAGLPRPRVRLAA